MSFVFKVAGEANIDQINEALRRYSERECFIREALVHLYTLTNETDEPQPDVLKARCSLLMFGVLNSFPLISCSGEAIGQ